LHLERAAFSRGARAGAEYWPGHPRLLLSRWRPGGRGRRQITSNSDKCGARGHAFRNGALSHRLKPLGQNDLRIGALCFPPDALERSMTNPNPLLGRLKPGWQSMGKGKSCGLAPTPFRNGTLSRRRSRAQFASREAHQASTHEGAPLRDFTTESQNSIRRCPTRSGARSRAVSNTRYHYDPGRT